MNPDSNNMMVLFLTLALMATSEAFFLKWGSDSSSQASSQKSWVQPLPPSMSPFRYQYAYSPYDSRKIYQIQNPQYSQAEMQNIQNMQIQQNLAPIPISVPAGAALTPVSLQHVQLVPCMCPVAPEEADKLQEQVGPGPYMAQTYTQPSYPVQQMTAAADNSKPNTKQ